eukprot:Skav209646  [mRNA]  locus=scaffold650:69467:73538:- [translate_table: standard]
MLQWLDERLTEAEICYWITGGTLLGAMRHQGFIPHDDDLDIELFEADLPRAQEVLGAVGSSYRGLGQWPNSSVAMGRFFFWGADGRFSESVDVFLREGRPLKAQGLPWEALDEFPEDAEVFPLVRLPFHNLRVPAPCKAQSFLARCYGASWAEEVVVWSHSSCSRQMHRLPLAKYMEGVWAAGYAAPTVADASRADLSAVGLECSGDLRRGALRSGYALEMSHLWQSLGWASPWPLDDDDSALDLLGLEERCWSADDALGKQLSHWMATKGDAACRAAVERVKEITGCFLELHGGGSVLRAVGAAGELDAVEPAFFEIFSA